MIEILGLGLILWGLSKKKEVKPQTQKKILRFENEKHNRYVENLAKEIGVPAEWIFGIMTFETARTLSPKSKVNCKGYGQNTNVDYCCGGLIGFCPVYAGGSYIDGSKPYQKGNILEQDIDYQLRYVRKFFLDGIKTYGRIKSKLDCYLLVFYPAAIKHSNNPNYIVGTGYSPNQHQVKAQNPAFRDPKANGYVTIRKIKEVTENWF
jgi:hypothetical protein